MLPVIAIIGRPNVGKSTLFNRLSRTKKAIVINEPGATRDRNYADCTWNDKPFLLIDTGGFEPASTEGIMSQMREQTLLALEEADIIVFLMDARDGLTPSDREIAGILRTTGKPVFFVVNKIDGPRHENLAPEFYALGVETLYPLSAEHGYGVNEFMDSVAAHLPEPQEAATDEEQPIRIAVIGRPNVGKSSLVNKILGYERTIVNPLPGTTRDAIDTPIRVAGQDYLLIDTAGIRRKSRVSLNLEKYSVVHALKAMERCDIALVLIDAEEGITEQDVKIAGLTLEKGTAAIVVVNKWDLVEKDDRTVGRYVKEIKEDLKFMDFAPILFISALSGQRVSKIFGVVSTVYRQYTRRIGTPELNKTMREVIAANPPPQFRNRDVQFGYMTQVAVKPPSFVFFTRHPKSIHFSYQRFLVNRLRESFGFDQVPLRIFFRK